MSYKDILDNAPAGLVEIYEEAERDIIADMARRLAQTDFTPSAGWQAKKLREMGYTYKNIRRRLAKETGKTVAEIEYMIAAGGQSALIRLEPGPRRPAKKRKRCCREPTSA